MTMQIIFTGHELSLSYDFVQFLHMYRGLGDVETRDWYNQQLETSHYNDKEKKQEHLDKMVKELDKDKEALEKIKDVYKIYKCLMLGKHEDIEFLQNVHFIFIVGAPRTGGTFLTKQIYNSMKMDYKDVPYSIGHDGFPAPRPFTMDEEVGNNVTDFYLKLAEYIVMAHTYYLEMQKDKDLLSVDGKVIIPKKLCNLPFEYNLFRDIFPNSTYVVTYRDPAGFLCSCLDKRMTDNPREGFDIKLTIDLWAEHLLINRGFQVQKKGDGEYWKVLLEYHKKYYMELLTCGLLSHPSVYTFKFGEDMDNILPRLGLPDGDQNDKFLVSEPRKLPQDIYKTCQQQGKWLNGLYKKLGYKGEF